VNHVWTWSGKYFGYIDNGNLWSAKGEHVGCVVDDEIFAANGKYIGEIHSDNRLITSKFKKDKEAGSFLPYSSRVGVVPCVDYVGYVMLAGYEDFEL
jgi:hypothetical protein